MNDQSLAQLSLFSDPESPRDEPVNYCTSFTLHDAWLRSDSLPPYITRSATVMRILDLIGPLDWRHFPERDLKPTFGLPPVPYAALVGAELIRLNEGLRSLKHLHLFLSEHPGFISLLGFSP